MPVRTRLCWGSGALALSGLITILAALHCGGSTNSPGDAESESSKFKLTLNASPDVSTVCFGSTVTFTATLTCKEPYGPASYHGVTITVDNGYGSDASGAGSASTTVCGDQTGTNKIRVTATGEDCPTVTKGIDVIRVGTATPDGVYVGSGKDTDTVTLEADLEPDLAGVTWAWSKASGPGTGTFTPSTTADTEFRGTAKGELVVKAEATVAGATCSDTQNLTVIEIDELSEDVDYQFMEMVYESTGSFSVDFSGAGGNLRSVLVAPPGDSSDPYEWDTDFYGQVDHITGSVDMTFVRDGEYVLRIERESGGVASVQYVEVFVNSGDSPDEPQRTKTTTVLPKPSADLVLISDSANDTTGFLVNARASISGEQTMSSVDDAVSKIEAKFVATGNVKFSLLIVDHGRAGYMSMGDGTGATPGKYIERCATADLKKFTDACKDRVTQVTFAGCEVGKDTAGASFLKKVADDGKCIVRAWDKKIQCRKDGTWAVDRNAGWVEASPSP